MFVPSGAGSVLSAPSPIKGSVEAIETARSFAMDVVSDCRGYQFSISTASNQLVASRSSAIAQVQSKVASTLTSGVALLEQSAGDASDGFKSYASEVDRIHGDARKLRERVRTSLDDIRAQSTTIEEICEAINTTAPTDWKAPPPLAMPKPALGPGAPDMDADARERHLQMLETTYSPMWWSAAQNWQTAYDDIVVDKGKWEDLVSERRAAERALLTSLVETDLGRLIQAGGTGGYSVKEMVAYGFSGELRGKEPVRRGGRDSEVEAALDAAKSPKKVAEAWEKLGLTPEEVAKLPMGTLARLAKCNGLPAWAQDIASRELLHFSIVAPEDAYDLFEFGSNGPSISEFHSQLLKLHEAWQTAKQEAARMGGNPSVQLLALGSHDGAMTAAISHGDLDTASHIGVNISGMLSNVGDIGQDAKGARSLYNEAYKANRSQMYAAVTWIGYKSPGFVNVNLMGRANAGATELSTFIDGVFASRDGSGAPITNFTVFAHSYGSTTAALALETIKQPITSFVTYGSAGLQQSTIEKIQADEVFSTHGSGDQTAGFGKLWGHPNDPRDMPGVEVFPRKSVESDLRVTAHDMFTEDASPSPLNWGGKVGYLTPGTRTAEDMGRIWANGRL